MKTIAVKPNEACLCVEDDISRRAWFISKHRIPQAFLAETPTQAIRILDTFSHFGVIFLDYDLALGVSSESVARYLAETQFAGRVVIHTANPFGRDMLQQICPNAEILPFGSFEITR